ncbi:MAG: Asp-tRNA(Asn)/Glu-tRNA(Gln) amidotransferase subunit GatC [Haliea sp.]
MTAVAANRQRSFIFLCSQGAYCSTYQVDGGIAQLTVRLAADVVGAKNVLREDVVVPGPDREGMMGNAPSTIQGLVRVPQMMEES